jgi:ATP-dependent DNA ligase
MIISEANKSQLERFPRLFKKTNTGAIQYWDIFVQEKSTQGDMELPQAAGEIVTMYGQLGTESPQRTADLVIEGKNPGKKNETSAFEQALKEAKSKWEKQKKKGYVETQAGALAQEVDEELVAGGLFPMLAQSFSKHASKIKWPAYIQPKLDGIRCIAIVKNGKATLWSRTRKPITSCPHIVAELEANFENITLDGELYNHTMKADFEKIVSLVRQEAPAEGHEIVQYHVYDLVSDKIFADRTDELQSALSTVNMDIIVPVMTGGVTDESQVSEMFVQVRSNGYEGVMLRNGDSKYEQNKRSYGLQKVKEFDSDEFDVVGIEEGRGKLTGHVGAFVCKTKAGTQFLAKMSGSLEGLKKMFENPSLWQDKKLTVQYQGLTGANSVPRFPVGIAIRDYE